MGFHILPFASIFVLWCLVYVNIDAQRQLLLNDSCELADGKTGQCVRFENCSAAIDMVRRRVGTPERCGFAGRHPIVCCEFKADLRQRTVGEISKQKCRETYFALPAVTTQAPVTVPTTTEDPNAEISIADLIKQAEKEEEEAKLGGRPTNTFHKTVVGGVNARAKEFTHMAALGYGEWSTVTWGCGGSLISDKYVLSAGHCIDTALGPVKYVRLGDLDLILTGDVAMPQDFTVARAIIHPLYKGPSVYHDIAIIELSANAVIDDFVRPGCLYTDTDIADETWIATGWGVTSFMGTPANHLQEVKLRPFTREECQTTYASTSKRRLSNGIDFNSQVCAGEAFKDTCQGDSGGPLQIRNSEFARGYKVIGITSFGKACGIGTGPSVYTRVSHYVEWIESIVWPQ